ncbi:hypothetical protein [Jatrophihabitans fulvus]
MLLTLALAAGVVLSAQPVGASPSKPAPTPTTGPLLRLDLPGVVTVEVPQVPQLLPGVLGARPPAPSTAAAGPTGPRTSAAARPTRAQPAPTAAPRQQSAPRRQTRPQTRPAAAPKPVRRTAVNRAVPVRAAAPAPSAVSTVVSAPSRPAPVRTPGRTRAAQRDETAVQTLFRRSVIPGVPTWVLMLVLAGFLAGTTVVVRAAGRRPGLQPVRARHHRR